MISKRCGRCDEEKTLDNFWPNKGGKYGVHSTCKACKLTLSREWQERNRDKCRSYGRAYHQRHPERRVAQSKRWRMAHPEEWRAIKARWAAKNRDRINAQAARWRALNAEKARETNRRCYQNSEEARRDYNLRSHYGISIEQYKAMYEKQGGKCLTCGDAKPLRGRDSLCVDHNHDTGKVRELLCARCNKALGCVRENPEALRALADYAERHRKENAIDRPTSSV